jgi:hypothetical protein
MRKTLLALTIGALLYQVPSIGDYMSKKIAQVHDAEYDDAWRDAERGPWVTVTIAPSAYDVQGLFRKHCIDGAKGRAYRNRVIAQNPKHMRINGEAYENTQTPVILPGKLQMIDRCKHEK